MKLQHIAYIISELLSRTLYGVRGLKYFLPVYVFFLVVLSRTLYGVRGLKYQPISHNLIVVIRRTLYGVRGLKSLFVGIEPSWNRSHSVWSAWIEIATLLAILTAISVALCMECVD